MGTAQQRYSEGIAKVLTAQTVEGFRSEYAKFIDSLIGVANWKSIYEAKSKRWIDWMTGNKFDDRPQMVGCTPVAKWKAVMGW